MATQDSNSDQAPPRKNLLQWIDWGNAPQWLSAVCAIVLASLAIWGIFFSETSQALVTYLQSELAVRNQRIATLELREQELQLSIATARQNLRGLAEQKAELGKQVSQLKTEQDSLQTKVTQLGSTLANTEFSLIRERINSEMSSGLSELAVLRITLSDDLFTAQGVRPRIIKPWDSFVRAIRRASEKLTDRDKVLAEIVIEKFLQQCARYKEAMVQIPAMRIPKDADFSQYNYNRDKHPIAIRLETFGKRIEKIERDIHDCFNAVVPSRI